MTGDSVGSQSRSRAVLAHVLASAPACGEVSRLLCHADYIRSSELDQYVFHVKPHACMAMTRQLLNQVTELRRTGNVWKVQLT